METVMMKTKKTVRLVLQVISLNLLLILVSRYVTRYNFFSRAAHIWFPVLFADVLLFCCLAFGYLRTSPGRLYIKVTAIVLALYVVLAPASVFIPIGSDWRPYTFEAERAAIEAARAIPDDQNAALLYKSLFEKLGPSPELPECVKDNQKALLGGPWNTETDPEASEWLKTQTDTIDTLMRISQIPQCRFPLQSQALDTPARFAQLKFAVMLLVLSANADIADGNTLTGLDKSFALMRIAGHSLQQPNGIDMLIGFASERFSLVPPRYLIVKGDLNESLLAMIAQCMLVDDRWTEMWPPVLEGSTLVLKNTLGSFYEVNPRGRTRFTANWSDILDIEWETKTDRMLLNFGPLFLAACAPSHPQVFGKVIDEVYAPLKEESFDWKDLSAFEEHRAKALRQLAGVRIIVDVMTSDAPALSKFYGIYLGQIAAKRGTHLLIGIRRYEMVNGRWPETLSGAVSLAPAEAFVDPTNGGEFVYKLTDDGFRLYSKGQNGTDDGGKGDHKMGTDDMLIWPLADNDDAQASDEVPPGEEDSTRASPE